MSYVAADAIDGRCICSNQLFQFRFMVIGGSQHCGHAVAEEEEVSTFGNILEFH